MYIVQYSHPIMMTNVGQKYILDYVTYFQHWRLIWWLLLLLSVCLQFAVTVLCVQCYIDYFSWLLITNITVSSLLTGIHFCSYFKLGCKWESFFEVTEAGLLKAEW